MSIGFKALTLIEVNGKTQPQISDLKITDLPEGDVLVDIEYSSLNYKDAMAITGTGKIVREFPMVPGIDFAGTVLESQSSEYKKGDKVILTGWGVGERYWGGMSQKQRVSSKWLMHQPSGLDSLRAMTIGTAGLTAMLCVMALEDAGIHSGKVLVTGASGGVGSVAIMLLANLGFHVTALSQNPEKTKDYLHKLGASEVIGGVEWTEKPRALGAQRWDAVVDVVGGNILARALSETEYGGAVAACGLAGSFALETTVMPFILRGVRLLGVDSVMCPVAKRSVAWERLSKEFTPSYAEMTQRIVGLDEVEAISKEMMSGQARGRVVVDVNRLA